VLLGAAAALAAACAGAPEPARAPLAPVDAGALRAAPGPVDAGREAAPADPLPSLEALAQGAARSAPGMREVLRRELDAPAEATRIELVVAAADTCLRVRLVAAAPLRATLETGTGATLAETPASADVMLGERGPVCVRRGERVTLVVAPREPARVRFVAWASP
jgi:hypothetical protein